VKCGGSFMDSPAPGFRPGAVGGNLFLKAAQLPGTIGQRRQ
jgi:hypothetical protein